MKLCDKVCACGQAFKTRHRAGRHCSPSCKEKAYRERLEKVYLAKREATELFERSCRVCDQIFTTKHTTKETCSKQCSDDLRRSIDRENYYKDPAKRFASNAARRSSQRKQTPSWYEKERIAEIYRQAKEGGKHVDHIVPLNHPLVSGLHVEANLQLTSPAYNLKKGNRHWPDMPQGL